MHRIMLLDDNRSILSALSRDLHGLDYEIQTFTDVDQALKCAQSARFDLVISDYRMPHMSGIEFLNQIKDCQPDAARMLLTGHADIEIILAEIDELGSIRYMTKPWDAEALRAAVAAALECGNTHEA